MVLIYNNFTPNIASHQRCNSSRKMSDNCLTGFLRCVYRVHGAVKEMKADI
jgi:hypothetical protein